MNEAAERFALVIGPAAEAIVARDEAAECGPVAMCDCRDITDSAGLRRRLAELAEDPDWPTITIVFRNVGAVLHDADALALFLRFGRSPEEALAVRPVLRLLDRVLAGTHRTISLTRREVHLLTVLAVNGAPVKARRLTEILWPGTPGQLACRTLRVYISRLRKRFAPEPVIELTAQGYRLAPEIGFDLADLEEDLAATEARERLNQTERGYLAGLEKKARHAFDESFEGTTARLQRVLYRISLLLTWSDLEAARFGIATARARVLVAENPFDETARRLLITALRLQGDRLGAARELAAFKAFLRTELNLPVPADLQSPRRQMRGDAAR